MLWKFGILVEMDGYHIKKMEDRPKRAGEEWIDRMVVVLQGKQSWKGQPQAEIDLQIDRVDKHTRMGGFADKHTRQCPNVIVYCNTGMRSE